MRQLVLLALACASCATGITSADPTMTLGFDTVSLPGGVFMMGTADDCGDDPCSGDHLPHPVSLPAFRIDVTEVSLLQYTVCVGKGLCSAADTWDYDSRNHPVTGVTRDQAREYCARMAGGRLPTEAEWELAARLQQSGDLTKFPWGGTSPDVENTDCASAPYAGCKLPVNDVGTNDFDVTTRGMRDMGGNVAEWVEDDYTPGIGCASRTPMDALCAGQSHCMIDGCTTGFKDACRTACQSGLVKMDHALYCQAASAVTAPLYRTTMPALMVKGGGTDLKACMSGAGQRGLIVPGRRPATGFRCAFNVNASAPAATPTARFGFTFDAMTKCTDVKVTPISPVVAMWKGAHAGLVTDGTSHVDGTGDSNGVYTFPDCGMPTGGALVVENAPAANVTVQIAVGMKCYQASLDLSFGEPALALITQAVDAACQ